MTTKPDPCAVILATSNVLIHSAIELERLFAKSFYAEYKTRLCGGAEEPLYKPASNIVGLNSNSVGDSAQYGACHDESRDESTARGNEPAASCTDHTIYYREDFYASALHEISHWCIAGYNRRKMLDFGYWYTSEGRNKIGQQKFYAVEQKPQAIEYLFSIAAGYPFRVSADNPGQSCDSYDFWQQVNLQAVAYCKRGMPLRAKQFCQALLAFYQPDVEFITWFNSLEALLLKRHQLK